MNSVLITALLSVGLLVGLVALRGLSKGRLEVKLTDAIIAVIPAVVLLVATGQIAELALSPEGLSLKTAVRNAAASPISNDVSPLPATKVDLAIKGSVNAIPELILQGKQGLIFRVSAGGYVGGAIRDYFTSLTQYPFFRYVVLENPDQSLFGAFDAHRLAALLAENTPSYNWNTFAEMLNLGQTDRILKMPGLIKAEDAVPFNAGKEKALKRLVDLKIDWLPVVDDQGHFYGVVDRAGLIASLIVDVTTQLQH